MSVGYRTIFPLIFSIHLPITLRGNPACTAHYRSYRRAASVEHIAAGTLFAKWANFGRARRLWHFSQSTKSICTTCERLERARQRKYFML
jgi:hypothetical protein